MRLTPAHCGARRDGARRRTGRGRRGPVLPSRSPTRSCSGRSAPSANTAHADARGRPRSAASGASGPHPVRGDTVSAAESTAGGRRGPDGGANRSAGGTISVDGPTCTTADLPRATRSAYRKDAEVSHRRRLRAHQRKRACGGCGRRASRSQAGSGPRPGSRRRGSCRWGPGRLAGGRSEETCGVGIAPAVSGSGRRRRPLTVLRPAPCHRRRPAGSEGSDRTGSGIDRGGQPPCACENVLRGSRRVVAGPEGNLAEQRQGLDACAARRRCRELRPARAVPRPDGRPGRVVDRQHDSDVIEMTTPGAGAMSVGHAQALVLDCGQHLVARRGCPVAA